MNYEELMGPETLVGNEVYNQNGENLGDIKEIMLDMRNGKIGYAVLSFSSFLGMGEKLFAVPWDALKLDTEHKRFVLDVGNDRLKEALGFDREKWPNMADPCWVSAVFTTTTAPNRSRTSCAQSASYPPPP